MNEMKGKKRIAFVTLLIFASLAVGALLGSSFHKQIIRANAAGFWLKGAEALKNGNNDYALLYFVQAIALKNDEPLFFYSTAEVYEKQKKSGMAVEFYKLALKLYKKEKVGPIKAITEKIELLEGTR